MLACGQRLIYGHHFSIKRLPEICLCPKAREMIAKKKNYAAWKNINFAYTDKLNGME